MDNYIVYIHLNKINNKAYIGITKQNIKDRWRNGSGYPKTHQPAFANAIQKYGWENFKHIIWAENLSKKEAEIWEVRLIALFKTNVCKWDKDACGYNMTNGGDGNCGHKHTEEAKKKMRESHKNISDETRAKMSKARKGKYIGENHPLYGTHLSQEIIKKRSKSKSNAVYCVELNIVFNSAIEDSKKLKISQGNISSCCRGKRKTAGGYHWQFINETMKNIA